MEIPFAGACACGAIRYRCEAPPFVAYTCHCRVCQRITSSAFATCLHVPVESLRVVQGETTVRDRVADSGNRLSTHFCGACGSALFVANHARPRTRTIYVGTLDQPDEVEVSAHIWTRRRLPWVVLPEEHRVFDEAGDWRPDYAADPDRLLP